MAAPVRTTGLGVCRAAVACALGLGPGGASTAAALSPDRAVTQYVRESWTVRDGAPAGTITGITQTPDGYLWLATEGEGLFRFDGVSFTREEGLDRLFERRMLRVTSLLSGRDGTLWAGTGHGLARLRDGRWTAFDRGEAKDVRGLHEASDGAIWYARPWEGLYRVAADTVTTLPLSGRPHLVASDGSGTLWAGGYEGLWRVSSTGRRFLTAADGLPEPSVLALYGDAGGGVWLGFPQHGLTLMRDGRFVERLDERDGLSNNNVSTVLRDRDGMLWLGTVDGGLNRWHAGRFQVLTRVHGLTNDHVTALYEDREGSLWIGTAGGLARLRDASVLPIGSEEGLSPRRPLSIVEGRGGTVFVSSGFGGLNVIEGGRIRVLPPHSVPGSNFDGPLHADPDGGVWSPYRGGLAYRGPRGNRRYRVDGQVTAITRDAQGLVYAVGTGEVFRLRGGRPARYRLGDGALLGPESFGFDYVWMLHVARDGTLWLATSRGAIAVRDGRARSVWRQGTLSARSIFEDDKDVVWLGTMAGAVRVAGDSVAQLTAASGLPDDDVHNVLNDGQGGVWFAGAHGLARAALREVEDVMAGRAERLTLDSFGVSEGMRSPMATVHYQPSARLASDGRLWFATADGVAVVDPRRLRKNALAPPVLVEEVLADDARLAPAGDGGELVVPARTERLAIRYSGLSLLVPQRVRFRYRLEGYDGEWVDAGARRAAFYTKPPPGRYRFRVRAANNDGVWNEQGAALTLRVLPPFWQTPLFRLAAVLGLGGVLLLGHRLRVRRIHAVARDLALKVEERTRDLNRLNAELAERTRRSATHLETIVTSAAVALWSFDHGGVITVSEGRALAGMGFAPGEQVGQSAFEVFRELPELARDLRRALAGETLTTHLRVADHVFEAYHTPIPDRQGASAGSIAVLVDVTDRARAEEERSRLETHLLHSQKMESVGRLAGGVAHDFNNMLMVILGFSELIKRRRPEDARLLADVLEIEKAAGRARDITGQLLAFSRKQLIEPRPLDLTGLLVDMRRTLGRLIGEDIDLRFHLAPGLWPVLLDPSQVDQILMNLAVNARDAMPDGGRLTVETSNVTLDEAYCRRHAGFEPGEFVLLTVSDSGVGMDRETLAHIFEPFFTTKAVGKGTGLGLATVYGIVTQNRGVITVDSEPGRGASFKVYLPRLRDARAAGPGAEEAPVAAGGGTVLVVEDDEAVRGLTARMVDALGFSVLVAAGAQEALAIAGQESRIDLLLTDVVMPGMSGKQLSESLRTRRPALRVLFTSGYGAEVLAQHGVLQDGVHFIQKPFTMDGLARKIRASLRPE